MGAIIQLSLTYPIWIGFDYPPPCCHMFISNSMKSLFSKENRHDFFETNIKIPLVKARRYNFFCGFAQIFISLEILTEVSLLAATRKFWH